MGAANSSIAQLQTVFTQFQTDASTFFGNQATFNAKLTAFLASLGTSTGTTLSATDQATVNELVTNLGTLDTAADGLNTQLGSITLPTSPAS